MANTKRVEIELAFIGDGRVIERPRGVFRGGVPDPVLTPHFGFNVLPRSEDEEGTLPPTRSSESVSGAFQVNLWGTSADFRALGAYLLAIAELDATVDPGFHQHHDELRSADGNTQIDLIVRKLRDPAT